MADISDIRPVQPTWHRVPARDERRKRRQDQARKRPEQPRPDAEEAHDDDGHIDEYA